jgi:hypothetical protein
MSTDEMMSAQNHDDAVCPKRLWVMLTLSDDEALEAGEGLPRGLQFHLSRCPSCRALADRLLAVSGTLRSLGDLEPSDDLRARANSQAIKALDEGARLTGRVSIPDEPERLTVPSYRPGLGVWLRYGTYAAAAALFLAVGLFTLVELRGPGDRKLADTTGDAPGPSRTLRDSPAKQVESIPEHEADGASKQLARGIEKPGAAETSGAHRPQTAEPGEQVAQVEPAEPTPNVPLGRRTRRPLCRYRSHVEAAMYEDPNCVYRAIILPDAGQRDLGWGRRLFDKPRSTESTKTRRKGE